MEKSNNLVCSTIKILHDLSRDRREPDRFLSVNSYDIIVQKDFIYINS